MNPIRRLIKKQLYALICLIQAQPWLYRLVIGTLNHTPRLKRLLGRKLLGTAMTDTTPRDKSLVYRKGKAISANSTASELIADRLERRLTTRKRA